MSPRRFVGLGVDVEVRGRLEAAIADVRHAWDACTWTDPSGWHVTLAFVGELPEGRLDELEGAVARGITRVVPPTGPPAWLVTGPVERFGERVAHVTVLDDPAGSVAVLGEAIQGELAAAGLPVHRRPVRPHVTLARGTRRCAVTPGLRTALDDICPRGLSWEAGAVRLYSSSPQPRRAAGYVVDRELELPAFGEGG